MANVKVNAAGGQFGGFTPYGNLTTLRYKLETGATGVPLDSNAAAALAINDVVRFQYPLPAGLLVEDVQLVVSDAFDASVTADVGFLYADGDDVTWAPQDADGYFAAQALSSLGRFRTSSSAKLFALPKDAHLVVTIKGAAVASAGRLEIIVNGERLGAV